MSESTTVRYGSDAAEPAVRRLLVAVAHNQPTVYAKAARSLVEIGWGNRIDEAKRLHGFEEICFQWQAIGARVDVLRNQTVRDAFAIGASHVLFLDADMTFPQDLLPRILAHADNQRIVGGLYVLKGPPFAPVALVNERRVNGVWWFDYLALDAEAEALRQLDVIGMGCTLIPVAAFRAVRAPWFQYRDDVDLEPRVSEDVAFCQAARSVGFTVWVDLTIQCGHLGVEPHDVTWAREWQARIDEMAETSPIVVSRV